MPRKSVVDDARAASSGAASVPATTRRRRGVLHAAEVEQLLTPIYGPYAFVARYDPTEELVYTILSQHTSDLNSERAFRRLRETFADWDAIVQAPVTAVEAAIAPGGLARTKAPRIQRVLQRVHELRGSYSLGFLATLPLGEAKAWLRDLPGVGPKTVACVLCFALGLPALPVDTHVYRVAQRLGLIGPKVTADGAHDLLEASLPAEAVYAFHMDLIQHGRQVCKAQRPRCDDCVLAERCPARATVPNSRIHRKERAA